MVQLRSLKSLRAPLPPSTPRLRQARDLPLPVLLGQPSSCEAAGGYGAVAPRAAGFHRCTRAGPWSFVCRTQTIQQQLTRVA